MRARTVRSLGVVAAAALLVGAFVATPAEAAKKKKKKPKGCPAVTFVEPESPSTSKTEVPGGEVVTVTDAHTAEAPLVIEFEHGPALWDWAHQEPIIEDTKWFNIQLDSAAAAANVNIRLEWPIPSPSDIDLFAWDAITGAELNHSGAANIAPVNVPVIGETGGMGWESISDLALTDCSGFSVESRAFWSAGESNMALKLWVSG